MQKVKFGANQFCGPAVISSFTGCTTDEAVRLIQQIRGNNKPVKGAYTLEVVEAFRRLGWSHSYLTHLSNCGNLFYLLTVLEDGQYLVMVPRHFIAIEVQGNQKFICDNHTRQPLNLTASARLGQSIQQVVKVEKR